MIEMSSEARDEMEKVVTAAGPDKGRTVRVFIAGHG